MVGEGMCTVRDDHLWAQEDSLCERLQLRNLMMARGHLIMVPILKLCHQHQSGSYLEELCDLRLRRPPWIKPFITCWHSCPALNAVCTPWESDDEALETWWVTDNLRLCKRLGRLFYAAASARPACALPAMPTASPGRRHHLGTSNPPRPPPPAPWPPSHLRRQTAGRKEIAHSRWGHLLWLGPSTHCVLVTCHLFLFSGLTTPQDRAFLVLGETQKGKGWGKADEASLRSG